MYCPFCGKEIEENSKFCAACGKSLETEASEPKTESPVEETEVLAEETAVLEETAFEAPVAEEAAVEAPTAENPSPASDPYAFAQPEEPKKPKKKAPLLVAICAVAALLIVLLFANLGTIKGGFVKTFGSDESYFEYVENKALSSSTEKISEVYGDYLDELGETSVGAEGEISLIVGDKAIKLLEEALDDGTGMDVDLDWLNGMTLKMDTDFKKDLMKVYAQLNVNKKKVADMDCILDTKNGEMFVALLSLSEKYLSTELELDEDALQMSELLNNKELVSALPSEKELNRLLDKYTQIIFENLDDVKKSSEMVSIGEIEQKLTTLEVEITGESYQKALRAVLEAASKDKDLKKYIEDAAKYLEKKDLIDSAGDVYESFLEGVEYALEAVDEFDPDDFDTEIVLTDYVNSKHEIVGRKLEVEDEEVLSYAKVKKGKKFAFELDAADMLKIKGMGTEKGDIVNGEFSVKYADMKVCMITLEDFDTDSDTPNGTIIIAPTSNLLRELGLESTLSSMLSLASPTLRIEMESSKKSYRISIQLLSDEETFVGITVSAKETGAKSVKKPASKDVYEFDEAEDWAEELDYDKLFKAMKKAGIPSDLIEELEDLV